MQPDLKSRHAISLEFSTTLLLSKDLVSEIRNKSHPDEDGDSVFFDSYRNHRALAVAKGVTREDTNSFQVEFTYQARSGGKLPKSLARVEQLMNILTLVEEQANFECRVSFVFGRKLRPRPIIGLPMKYIEAPNMPFDRIQGLHLVKIANNEAKYDIFLEAPSYGIIVENVIFKHTSPIDNALASNILKEAVSISDRFVSWRQTNARKTG
jgi:hypothetical protein